MIVGGVDLLKKAEEQEKLLEQSNAELQQRQQQQDELRKQIEDKEVMLRKSTSFELYSLGLTKFSTSFYTG